MLESLIVSWTCSILARDWEGRLLSISYSLEDFDDRQHFCTTELTVLNSSSLTAMLHVPEPLQKTLIFFFPFPKVNILVFSLVPERGGGPYRKAFVQIFVCVSVFISEKITSETIY